MCQGHQPVVQLIELYIGDHSPCVLCGCTHDPVLNHDYMCSTCSEASVQTCTTKKMKRYKACKKCGITYDCATEDQDYVGYCRDCIYEGNTCKDCGAPICSSCERECELIYIDGSTYRWTCPLCRKHCIPMKAVPRLFQ